MKKYFQGRNNWKKNIYMLKSEKEYTYFRKRRMKGIRNQNEYPFI